MSNWENDIEIRRLRDSDIERAYALKIEYLDPMPLAEWSARRGKYPELFCGCALQGELIGVCYGWPFREDRPELLDTLLLYGIAVISDYNGRGYGSRLLHFWEQQAVQSGRWTVSVGSASGYVDGFYLKNGYHPVHYMISLPAESCPPEALRLRYDIAAERVEHGRRLLYVPIDALDEGLRQRLLADFAADEVIAIMEKRL